MNRAALIALGSNQPFAGVGGVVLLRQAIAALGSAGLKPGPVSSAWRSPAWPPGSAQPDYFNAVVVAEAGALEPEALYGRLRAIETAFGRERRERWGARTLDLDILALGDLVGEFGSLTLPHKRLHERAFVLLPLAEVAPAWRHPILDQTAAELAKGLSPDHGARRIDQDGFRLKN